MKNLILVFFLQCSLYAQEYKADKLVIAGTTYEGVIISLKTSSEASIIHSTGVKRVLAADLPPEVQEKIGYGVEVPKGNITTKLDEDLWTGLAFYSGSGVTKDFTEAAKWFHKSAERGGPMSQFMLGRMYMYAEGVRKDETAGVKWYRKAADQGHLAAQVALAQCYAEGVGLPKNEIEAVNWYRKAAEGGDATGQIGLGICYATPIGVEKDLTEAVKWVRKAAEQDDEVAQYGMGCYYYAGNGLPKDYVKAYMWLNLSAAKGHEEAKKLRSTIERSLTREQLLEAQKLSSEWKPEN